MDCSDSTTLPQPLQRHPEGPCQTRNVPQRPHRISGLSCDEQRSQRWIYRVPLLFFGSLAKQTGHMPERLRLACFFGRCGREGNCSSFSFKSRRRILREDCRFVNGVARSPCSGRLWRFVIRFAIGCTRNRHRSILRRRTFAVTRRRP